MGFIRCGRMMENNMFNGRLSPKVLVNGLLVGNKELTLDVSGDGNVNIIDLIKMKNQIANM